MSKPIPEKDCELWYDGCVVCPTSKLKDFKKDDVICNPETCDMELRKEPYCVQEFQNRKDPTEGIIFCDNSPPQLCRRLCTNMDYPSCDGEEYCVYRSNSCCNFECRLSEGYLPANNDIKPSNKESDFNQLYVGIPLALAAILAIIMFTSVYKKKKRNEEEYEALKGNTSEDEE